MTPVRPALLAAVPLLALGLALAPSSAPADTSESCNGYLDVALGTPDDDVAGAEDAGRVTLVFESDSGSFTNPADLTISEEDLGGTAAANNNFGASVTWGFDDTLSAGCTVVAIGAPGADNGRGKVYVAVVDKDGINASTVKVLTQGADGLSGPAESGDRFGSSLLFGGDLAVRWLAIGSPYEDVGSKSNAGMVHVMKINDDWTGAAESYTQGKKPLPGKAEAGDVFGKSLGAGYDVHSLWAGSPGEDLGNKSNAGAIVALPGKCSGACESPGAVKLPGTVGGVKAITQDTKGVPGASENGDEFGEVLSGYATGKAGERQPVVGLPHENIGKKKDAGAIIVAYKDKSWAAFQQGTKAGGGKVDGKPEGGDQFGAALSAFNDVILIGVPGEDLGKASGAGAIHFMAASSSSYRLSPTREWSYTQNTKGVEGGAEKGDRFGSSVAFSVNGGVVGVPSEDFAIESVSYTNAGVVHFFPFKSAGYTKGLSTGQDLLRGAGSEDMGGAFQNGAGFGAVGFSVTQ